MAEATESMEPPLTEPLLIPCLFVTGIGLELTEGVVRIVGWVQMPDLGGEAIERRIVIRMALPVGAARPVPAALRKLIMMGSQ